MSTIKTYVRALMNTDLSAVAALYRSVLNDNYISYGEMHLGLADSPREPSQDACNLFHQELLDILGNKNRRSFVACINDQVVGFAIASLRNDAKGTPECWFDDLGVASNCRRNGIGELLANAVLSWASENGARYMYFESNVNNKALHEGALKAGFVPLSIIFVKALKY